MKRLSNRVYKLFLAVALILSILSAGFPIQISLASDNFGILSATSLLDGSPQWCCDEEYPLEQRFDMRFEGDGTKENPFQVCTARQLNHVRRHLEAYYIQMNDILINEDLNGALPGNFEPIGTMDDKMLGQPEYVLKAFIGVYDGNGKAILGLHIESVNKYNGLFGYAGRQYYPKGEIKNLTVGQGYVRGTPNATPPYDHQSVGGIAGIAQKIKITNCTNMLTVSAYEDETSIGGIAGTASMCTVSGCTNQGGVNSDFLHVDNLSVGYTGGLIGTNSYSAVTGCRNEGVVVGKTWTGGIIGYNGYHGYFKIDDCENTADIYVKSGIAGGIVGGGMIFYYSLAQKISNCSNSGDIILDRDVQMAQEFGGIAGWAFNAIIENCTNTGNIQIPGGEMIGGIVGSFAPSSDGKSAIRNCSNSGVISGDRWIGGIAGDFSGYNSEPLSNCSNTGNIIGHQRVGGIVGTNGSESVIEYCSNNGRIEGIVTGSASEQSAGGIAGHNGGIIAKCYNAADVSGTSDNIGGIAGRNDGTLIYQRIAVIEDCYNTGKV